MSNRVTWVAASVFSGLTIVFCLLGFWQLDRAREKEERLNIFETRWQSPVVDMNLFTPDQWHSAEHMFWRRVRITGHYPEDLPYFYLDNQIHKGIAGYNIYRLFRLSEDNHVPVQLGWQPVGMDREVLPVPPSVAAGALMLPVALVAPPAAGISLQPWSPEKRSLTEKNIWRLPSLSVEKLAGMLDKKILPYVARPMGEEVALIKPYGGLPPERHRGYAFQWFSLAVLCPLFFIGVKKWAS